MQQEIVRKEFARIKTLRKKKRKAFCSRSRETLRKSVV